MQAEQQEISAFLSSTAPFQYLSEPLLAKVLSQLEIRYFKAGSPILRLDQPAQFWYVIRKGVVEVFRRDGALYNRLGTGGYFGEFGLLMGKKVRFPVKAIEDTLCYVVPAALFSRMFDECEAFADYVEIEDNTRLKKAASYSQKTNLLLSAQVESILGSNVLTLPANLSAQEAASKMAEQGVTSVLVFEQDETTLTGIVTDQDFRIKLVAQGLPLTTPLRELMTSQPIVLEHDRPAFEAMMVMLRTGAHHLPVSKDGKVIGIVSQSDLVRHQSKSTLFVANNIGQANSIEELKSLQTDVTQAFIKMVEEDANSRMIGSAMASIGRSFKQRLIELAEKELGPPPVQYSFLALGSMAREEQLLVTDQDNAIVLSDAYQADLHQDYFTKLAKQVCDGLDACGYPYCTGGIMASNPKWMLTLSQWKALFQQWIDRPSAEGLLHSNVFFDLESVWGRADLAKQLSEQIRLHASKAPGFLSCMSRNALLRTPPLGFFKEFVLEKDGTHINTINMKRRGSGPLTDLIRVHTLATSGRARNSFARLAELEKTNLLLGGQAAKLRDALEVISMVRIKHQAEAASQGNTPDNQVDPAQLGTFERKNLKDAFQILNDAQHFLKFRYQSAGRG